MTILAPIFIGFLFGFFLHKGGMTLSQDRQRLPLHRYGCPQVHDVLAGCRHDRNLFVDRLGIVPSMPITPTYIVGNLFGGLLFGVGMATAGVCAAPIAAGSGEGRLDYIIPGILGMLGGALLFGLTYNQVYPAIKIANAAPSRCPK
jgi:ABC-type antimicrobial peptide transport system permease subunit